MLGKKFVLFAIISIFITFAPFSSHSDEVTTEVIITNQNGDILAFSSKSNHWVSISTKPKEEIISTESQGNVGIVVTTKRILWFSTLTNNWSYDDLNIKEEIEEITVKGNAAIIKTNKRAIGFSAHTGQRTVAHK